MAQIMIITNLQKRTFVLPAMPVQGAQPIIIGPGGAEPIELDHWEHILDGGKNEVMQALLQQRLLVAEKAEKYQAPEYAPALRNPESPKSPENLRDPLPEDDKRVTGTSTRTSKPPKVTPPEAGKKE